MKAVLTRVGMRNPIKRLPHTTPDKCLGHEYYLEKTELKRKAWKQRDDLRATYLCRYCALPLNSYFQGAK